MELNIEPNPKNNIFTVCLNSQKGNCFNKGNEIQNKVEEEPSSCSIWNHFSSCCYCSEKDETPDCMIR